MPTTSYFRPLLMSTIAGLATGLGGLLVGFVNTSTKSPHVAFCLGLSAGVMMTISLFDLLLPPLLNAFASEDSVVGALFLWLLCLVVGIAAEYGLSKVLPDDDEMGKDLLPFAMASVDPHGGKTTRRRRFRLGVLLAVTLAMHNFPEGLAVAASNLANEELGFLMTIAIAIHNIPEGLCVAVPIYASTGSLWQATKLATLSGCTEPLGAVVALLLFGVVDVRWHESLLQSVLVFVGGVMVRKTFFFKKPVFFSDIIFFVLQVLLLSSNNLLT